MKVARVACLLAFATAAAADTDPPSKWPEHADAKLGIKLHHPDGSKVTTHGQTLTVAGKGMPTVAIAVKSTTEKTVGKSGGIHEKHVDWTIAVPKRAATCTSDAADEDQATIASHVCDSIELAPGPRSPHVELAVESSGLADAAGYEKAVRGKQAAVDACWKTALAKDKELPEGAVELKRSWDHGELANTNERRNNFFDHDAKPLGKCIVAALGAVPVKTSGDAAAVKLTAICQYY